MARDIDNLFSAPWLRISRDVGGQTEYLKHIADVPAQRMIREMQDAYSRISPDWVSLIHSPVFEAMKQIQEGTQALRQVMNSRAFGLTFDIQQRNELWLKLLASPAQVMIAESETRYQDIVSSMALPALQAISDETLRYFESATSAGRFDESFVSQILERLQNISDAEDLEEVEKDADVIKGLFVDRIGSLHPDFISREGLIQVLLAIVLFWLQIYKGARTEDHIINTIRETESRILEQIDRLKPTESQEVFYLVLRRPAPIRTRPTAKKRAVEVLYPNQRVSLIERKGKWFHVKYFDYIEGAPKSGWVLKKYLKRSPEVAASMSSYPLGENHPLVSSFGAFENEPLWDDLMRAVHENRREEADKESGESGE